VNCATLVVVDDDKARAAPASVRRPREAFGAEGVKPSLAMIEEIP
jgi:hypothetical protein